ncbi:hypothetical protein [Ktedonobacter robiniae]|uniref:Uncharacterized protein n=1 Tax=Ktedonobacter robiniae TaxID=2778365 RepID=A0ABQ3V190_9CHLR|nr:hypothetical protein [Ktedonobacter robiniae]GHO58741.1 hypothetical protein KSB_72160 [Ktedonobacter robiniae]
MTQEIAVLSLVRNSIMNLVRLMLNQHEEKIDLYGYAGQQQILSVNRNVYVGVAQGIWGY